MIDAPGRAKVSALLVRPRSASGLLTALLEYRIAPGGEDQAIEAAAYGFAGMVAFTPRVRVSRHEWQVVPFEGEGERARAVIGWIAKQPWSDSQVGMYGDGYGGFVAWAAVKRLPPQLKAIATSDSMAPGVNFPMTRGIGLSSAYCWLERIQAEREESAATSGAGRARPGCPPAANGAVAPAADAGGAAPASPASPDWCRGLEAKWYAGGKAFRDLPRLAGRASPIFRRWLAHPTYDDYWRRLVPSPGELAHLDIPVLSLTGYYTAGEAGTLFYFLQHYEHDSHADQKLLAGPYDRAEIRAGRAQQVVSGYRTDPAAVIDLRQLELQWFAYLFLNGSKPALLADRVNMEVMGADAWQHAGALDDLAKDRARLYLAPEPGGGSGLLTPREPPGRATIHFTVNLARREKAAASRAPSSLITGSVPVENGFAFVSGPLPEGLEIAGRFGGRLHMRVNKRDVDLTVALYELLPDGNYFHLFAPAEEFRASQLRDPARRRLLLPDAPEWLDFTSARITAVRVESGARLVMVLRVSKLADREINYGSGRAASGDSIASGRTPVRLSLLRGSYLDLPIAEQPPAPLGLLPVTDREPSRAAGRWPRQMKVVAPLGPRRRL